MTATSRYAPVGARVRCAYWGEVYAVLEHVTRPDWRGASVVVRWETGPNAGRVIEHSTALAKRDRIIGADTGRMHGPRQRANQDGPLCASWYVDGLAAGGQRVAPVEIGRHIDFWPADS